MSGILNAIFGRKKTHRPAAPAPDPTPREVDEFLRPDVQSGRVTVIPGPFHPRMYSYWANAVVLRGVTYVFAGRDGRPQFFDIRNGVFIPLGQLVPDFGETEGWYWDAAGWVYVVEGNRLLRVNPFTGQRDTAFHAPPGFVLWQPHSSDDGQVHSATIKDAATWRKVGTVASYRGELRTFMARGELDESIVTKCGEWLIIQEDRLNRVVRLRDGWERAISQEDGAVGHCDTGHGFVVGEDDAHGACVRWDLEALERRELWQTWNMGHVAVRGNKILASNAESLTLSLYDLSADTHQQLLYHGVNAGGDYDRQVRANLSPCGTRACYMINNDVHVLEL